MQKVLRYFANVWLQRTQGFTAREVLDYVHMLRTNEARMLTFFHAEGAEREAVLYSNLRAHFEALERKIPCCTPLQ